MIDEFVKAQRRNIEVMVEDVVMKDHPRVLTLNQFGRQHDDMAGTDGIFDLLVICYILDGEFDDFEFFFAQEGQHELVSPIIALSCPNLQRIDASKQRKGTSSASIHGA